MPAEDGFEKRTEPVAIQQGVPRIRVEAHQDITHDLVQHEKLALFAPELLYVGLPVYEVLLLVHVDVELVHLFADDLCELDVAADVEEYRTRSY